jgi:hypothetical protein
MSNSRYRFSSADELWSWISWNHRSVWDSLKSIFSGSQCYRGAEVLPATDSMESRQPNIYASVGITGIAALLALCLRLLARRLTKISLWVDDYLAICALVSPAWHLTTDFILT